MFHLQIYDILVTKTLNGFIISARVNVRFVLPKEAADLFESRLSEKTLLAPGTKFSFYRHRKKDFNPFFEMDDAIICVDGKGLLGAMGCEYNADGVECSSTSREASLY